MRIPGTPDDIRQFDQSAQWVDDLLDFVQLFAPSFPDTIEGADDKLIGRLSTLAQTEVPPEYASYARCMGNNAGGLWQKLSTDFRLPPVIQFYEAWNDEPDSEDPINPNALVIAPQVVGELSIDLRPGHERAIWRTEAGDFNAYFAASLPRFAMQHAFRWHWKGLSHHICKFGATLVGEAEAVGSDQPNASREAIERELADFGLLPCWFRDDLRLFAVNQTDDIALMFTKVGGPPSFMVGASDAELGLRVGRHLAEVIGASPL